MISKTEPFVSINNTMVGFLNGIQPYNILIKFYSGGILIITALLDF